MQKKTSSGSNVIIQDDYLGGTAAVVGGVAVQENYTCAGTSAAGLFGEGAPSGAGG